MRVSRNSTDIKWRKKNLSNKKSMYKASEAWKCAAVFRKKPRPPRDSASRH